MRPELKHPVISRFRSESSSVTNTPGDENLRHCRTAPQGEVIGKTE